QLISDCPAPASKPDALLLPDILFELLPHLDFCSLLTCQRVCRTWASAISRSRDAQQRLFLVPDDRPFEAFKAAEE
ncbi:F-box protein, partial [Acetobacter senegalensis]|nr:F-box protein [Acetobacter senegalensis]